MIQMIRILALMYKKQACSIAFSCLDTSNANLPGHETDSDQPILDTIFTSEQEVLDIIRNINPHKATGPDGISPIAN